jgi:large subunit ribosomal protein L34
MPKRVWQPNKRKRVKTHGFLTRMKSPSGKNILRRRMRKGRKVLAPTHSTK